MRIGGLVLKAFCAGAFLTPSFATETNGHFSASVFSGIGGAQAAVWTITPLGDGFDRRIQIDCPGLSAVQVEGGLSLRIPSQIVSRPGAPDVPRLSRLLPGLRNARAVLTITGRDPTNVTGVVLAAAEGFRLDDPDSPTQALRPYRRPDPNIYGKDKYWPAELGRLEEGSVGTQKVVRVEFCPVQYNPVTGTIRFYRRLEGELRFEPKMAGQ